MKPTGITSNRFEVQTHSQLFFKKWHNSQYRLYLFLQFLGIPGCGDQSQLGGSRWPGHDKLVYGSRQHVHFAGPLSTNRVQPFDRHYVIGVGGNVVRSFCYQWRQLFDFSSSDEDQSVKEWQYLFCSMWQNNLHDNLTPDRAEDKECLKITSQHGGPLLLTEREPQTTFFHHEVGHLRYFP